MFTWRHSRLRVIFLVSLLMTSASLLYISRNLIYVSWENIQLKRLDENDKSLKVPTEQTLVEASIKLKSKILSSAPRISPSLHPKTQPVSSKPPTSFPGSPSFPTREEREREPGNEVAIPPSSYRDFPKQPELRRSLLIYGADRSGTTFTTKMFAEDPQMFTVYEPLWITSEWNKEDRAGVEKWKRNILDVLKGILSCDFAHSKAGTIFLSHTSKKWSGAFVKNPFTSPAFCKRSCQDLSKMPDYTDEVCLAKYKHSVTKLGEPRMPNQLLSSVIPAVLLENPDTDIRVIQLVRDPRGSFNSRIKLQWMEDFQRESFPRTVKLACSKLAENIKFGRSLGKWQDKYLEVHYRDLAQKPIETTKKMYKFAGFDMPQEILDWVEKNTSPTKEQLEKEAHEVFSSVRNSTANVDKWRAESPTERVRIIEKECDEVFELMKLENIT